MSVEGLVGAKHLSTMPRNFFPRFVFTFESHWGLYQVVFPFRFFFFLVVCPELNVSLNHSLFPQALSGRVGWLH